MSVKERLQGKDGWDPHLEQRDVIVDTVLGILHASNRPTSRNQNRTWEQGTSSTAGHSHALRYPRQVPDLLLLELDKAVKHGQPKLLQERVPVDMHLPLEEFVLEARPVRIPAPGSTVQATPARPGRFGSIVEKGLVFGDIFDAGLDRVDVFGTGEGVVAFWVETTDGREQLGPLFLAQLGTETVQRDWTRHTTTHGQSRLPLLHVSDSVRDPTHC